ncbi:MAG TPA: hypothetical protein VJW17_08730, partial [Pyrinomonadaceae bacterium]|nr:hypothetical protein [Pyrinomonadaceae bacterium]
NSAAIRSENGPVDNPASDFRTRTTSNQLKNRPLRVVVSLCEETYADVATTLLRETTGATLALLQTTLGGSGNDL